MLLEDTIFISTIPSLRGYDFKIRMEKTRSGKETIYIVKRLN